MEKKENFLTDFFNDYGIIVSIFLGFFSIVIPVTIWILLALQIEKGAEESWSISVGLFGSLIGGLCTLIAFLVSNYQTKKIQKENFKLSNNQLKLIILNDKISDYKNIKEKLFEIRDKIETMRMFSLSGIEAYLESSEYILNKKIYNLKTDILCIDDYEVRDFLDNILTTLLNTIESIKNKMTEGIYDIDKHQEDVKKAFENFLQLTNDTDDLLINIELLRAYDEKYNLINHNKKS